MYYYSSRGNHEGGSAAAVLCVLCQQYRHQACVTQRQSTHCCMPSELRT